MESDDPVARAKRAEERRKRMPGSIVEPGTPKVDLYRSLSPVQRLEALWDLCWTQWLAAHPTPPTLPRARWPSEVFDATKAE